MMYGHKDFSQQNIYGLPGNILIRSRNAQLK